MAVRAMRGVGHDIIIMDEAAHIDMERVWAMERANREACRQIIDSHAREKIEADLGTLSQD